MKTYCDEAFPLASFNQAKRVKPLGLCYLLIGLIFTLEATNHEHSQPIR